MKSPVRRELPTASAASSQAPTTAVDTSAPSAIHPESTYKSGNIVQTSKVASQFPLDKRMRHRMRHKSQIRRRFYFVRQLQANLRINDRRAYAQSHTSCEFERLTGSGSPTCVA